jgi:hypothetical protein
MPNTQQVGETQSLAKDIERYFTQAVVGTANSSRSENSDFVLFFKARALSLCRPYLRDFENSLEFNNAVVKLIIT